MKFRRKKIVEGHLKKEEEEFHLFIEIEFIQEKKSKQAAMWFLKLLVAYQKQQETYRTLMRKKNYINKKKFKRKKRRKQVIRGRGFADGFKLLYSLGKQWRNSMP